jgi:hypothetical protein
MERWVTSKSIEPIAIRLQASNLMPDRSATALSLPLSAKRRFSGAKFMRSDSLQYLPHPYEDNLQRNPIDRCPTTFPCRSTLSGHQRCHSHEPIGGIAVMSINEHGLIENS